MKKSKLKEKSMKTQRNKFKITNNIFFIIVIVNIYIVLCADVYVCKSIHLANATAEIRQ